MLAKEFNDGNLFEREVRSIARELWPSAEYHGSQIFKDKERDGLFVLEDTVHYLECTISKEERKTKGDLDKLTSIIDDMRKLHPKKAVKGWFITLHEATADQARHITHRRGIINHETFDSFRSKLVDASDLINLRMRYPFGSARNINDNSIDIPADEYVETHLFPDESTRPIGVRQVARSMIEHNRRYVLFGEYGVGKSMTLRQIFLELGRVYKSGGDLRFPIHINLRDHREINDVSDALRQHARSLGYKEESHLVRAFRAGYTFLILDGFDEAPPRVGSKDIQKTRELRKSALGLVRKFLKEAPSRTPIILAGRNNFFDSGDETKDALGIDEKFTLLSLTEFSEPQIEAYLKKKGSLNVLPPWLPRKPLLIGYFVIRNLTSLLTSGSTEQDIGAGWRSLIEAICEREVNQIEIGLYPFELMRLYSRIATKSRKKIHRLGPINFSESRDAFRELFDFEPEDRALTALLRLPGMTTSSADANSSKDGQDARWFVDESFLDALAALDMLPLIKDAYKEQTEIYRGIRHQLSQVGIRVAAAQCEKESIEETQLLSSLVRIGQRSPDSVVAIDLLQIARELGLESLSRMLILNDQLVEELFLNIDDSDFSNVTFQDSYFRKAYIDAANPDSLPFFNSCYFGEIRTPLSLEQLHRRFEKCELERVVVVRPIETFDSIDVRIGVMRSVLDKLFVQSLSGREERAFTRGVPQLAQSYVQPVLDILKKENFCFRRTLRGTPIWYPVRSRLPEARHLIGSIDFSESEIITAVMALS